MKAVDKFDRVGGRERPQRNCLIAASSRTSLGDVLALLGNGVRNHEIKVQHHGDSTVVRDRHTAGIGFRADANVTPEARSGRVRF